MYFDHECAWVFKIKAKQVPQDNPMNFVRSIQRSLTHNEIDMNFMYVTIVLKSDTAISLKFGSRIGKLQSAALHWKRHITIYDAKLQKNCK